LTVFSKGKEMTMQARHDLQQLMSSSRALCVGIGSIAIVLSIAALPAHAAISWDGGGNSNWWFDPANWSQDAFGYIPPSQDQGGTLIPIDAQINGGTGAWDVTGEGVVYDPVNDPFFSSAAGRAYATGSLLSTLPGYMRDYGPQTIYRFYVSRNTTNSNLVTIKSGDLAIESTTIIGRSGSSATGQNLGRVNQLGGTVRLPLTALDMGNSEASGWGNGTWDYRGGILEVSMDGGNGLRLAAGGSNGPGGHGRFIMHNPTTPGYVRAYHFNVAANAGSGALIPDGINTGVGIVEFHFENGGTRPIQVPTNLIINNGSTETGAIRSARLELKLDAAPMVNGSGVPQNLGLFDVDSNNDANGSSTTGAGQLGDFFSSADGSTLYDEGATVSASFGGTQYNWMITYQGNIAWTDPDTGALGSIDGTGGIDVVLVGQSSVSASLLGDYNDNGVVDAADYVLWRNNPTSLDNEGASPGVVDQADYTFWRTQFGKSAGGGAALVAAAVPEPGTMMMVVISLAVLLGTRRLSN
jgi:hypothetical protein